MRPGDFDKTRRWPPRFTAPAERPSRRFVSTGVLLIGGGIVALIVWAAFGWL